nr:retrovirus-related Pol polyprotein from transposon TNT 1-94 [Tanacetum cinerariifolium]
ITKRCGLRILFSKLYIYFYKPGGLGKQNNLSFIMSVKTGKLLAYLKVFGCESFVKVKDVCGEAMKCTFIGSSSNEMRYSFWDTKSHQVIRSRDITFVDSIYGARSMTYSSSLTKPIQKSQVVLVDIPENLAKNDNIVVEHALSSEITQRLGGSLDTSEGSKNSGSFEDSRRSYVKYSKDGASSKEGGSKTPRVRKSTRESRAPVSWRLDDALVCCVENTIEDRIMDSGASFHATYWKEELERFKLRSGKVRLVDDKNLDIADVGDVVFKTSFGTIWTLKDVMYIPSLKKRLISVGQLDKEGYHVGFEDSNGRLLKENYKGWSKFIKKAMALHLLHQSKDPATMILLSKIAAGVAENCKGWSKFIKKAMALHLLHQSKDPATMILLSKIAAGVAVVRAMMSLDGSIMASLKNFNGFLAVNTPPDDLIHTYFEQEGAVLEVMLHIFEEFVLLLGRHPLNNEVPRMNEEPCKDVHQVGDEREVKVLRRFNWPPIELITKDGVLPERVCAGAIYRTEVCTEVYASAIYPNKNTVSVILLEEKRDVDSYLIES